MMIQPVFFFWLCFFNLGTDVELLKPRSVVSLAASPINRSLFVKVTHEGVATADVASPRSFSAVEVGSKLFNLSFRP